MVNYDRHANFGIIWDTAILLVTVAPPLETLLTRFRKLQPSPLEVGDHLIWPDKLFVATRSKVMSRSSLYRDDLATIKR